MNEYDEYMFNPSTEFDEQIEELKDSLRSSVKGEFLERIAELEKELKELRELKENWNEKVNSLEKEKSKAFEEAKTMRLSELLSDFFCRAWGVTTEWYYPHEKCNKCDEDGYIRFKSPQGRICSEYCNCRKQLFRYIVTEARIVSVKKTHEKLKTFFEFVETKGDGEEELRTVSSDGFADNKEFTDIRSWNRVFQNKEKAQAYCDWLNQKQEEK